MSRTRLKTAPSKGAAPSVDREKHRLIGVSVMETGTAIGHGFEIDRETLASVVRLGNEATHGIKTRFTHPDMCNDGLGNELGRSVNFRLVEDGHRVLADLNLFDAAARSPNGDLRGWVMDMAEEDPAAVGMSVVMSGDLEEQRDEDGEPRVDGKGNTLPALYRPAVLHANDLVDEPAANRRGLFGNAELSAFAAATLDEAFASVMGVDAIFAEVGEQDLRAVALAAGIVGETAFSSGQHSISLSSDASLERAAGFVNAYLDRRGVVHPPVDAELLRRVLTPQQRTPTMPKDTPLDTGPAATDPPINDPPVVDPPAPAPAPVPAPALLSATAVAEAVQAENQRVQEIRSLGRLFPDYDLTEVVDGCTNDTGCSVADAQTRLLAAVATSQANPETMNAPISVGRSSTEKFVDAASDAMLLRSGSHKFTAEETATIRATGLAGLGPKQIARQALKAAGVPGVDRMPDSSLFSTAMGHQAGTIAIADDNDPHRLLAVGHATGDFPLILANAGNKAMIGGYELAAVTWRLWCKAGNLVDFKVAKRLRLSEAPLLVDRPEGLPAEMGTFDEQGEDIQLVNRAKGFSYTRQMFVNDDLGAFLDLGRRFGNGAAQTIERLVYESLTSNSKVGPTMSDSSALFHAADHSNLSSGGGGAPTQTLIDEMVEAMMIQTGIGEDGAKLTVGAPPKYFLAKPSVAMKISAIIDAPFRGTSAAGDAQSLHAPQDSVIAAAVAIKVPQLALQASTDWYGVADQNAAPSYEVAFLNGIQTPRTKAIVGTTVDGTTIVVDLDFGIFPTGGWQGINRNAGA